jgi:hypothetical protein
MTEASYRDSTNEEVSALSYQLTLQEAASLTDEGSE